MGTKLIINKLVAYAESNNKYFHSEFDNGVNVIYGKNTSGKSTVFQLILYTFGINDNNDYLKEIIDEEVIIRVDCQLLKNNNTEQVIFIREDETLYIKRGKFPTIKFNGIKANNSAEHIKLKEYMHELFDFSLRLENKDGYNVAPIEAMFLPYYIPQSVGWVYLRKAFSGFEFYKNFKNDYLDYYLGIESFVDREKKQKLELQLKSKEDEMKFFINLEQNNEEFLVTKLVDEQFTELSKEYIGSHSENQQILIEKEEKFISKCNELSYYLERKSLLRMISKNHKKQNPISGKCPSCNQELPFSIGESYKYLQEQNDTKKEVEHCKHKIKSLQSEINSLRKEIDKRKNRKMKEYEILKKYKKYNVSFDNWLRDKVNIQLIDNIKHKLGELTSEKEKISNDLKAFKTEEDVESSRLVKSKEFAKIFQSYLDELGVKPLKEDRYKSLYQISAFPSQGVELHKTVLAYNFAFNKVIEKTDPIHRFPFMLDAIFKEDIDPANKNKIIEFIGTNKPDDTQVILSIAETKEYENNIYRFNNDYFNGEAKLICIGELIKERAFLSNYDGSIDDYLEETFEIIN
ncbi:hypothetical protein CACET_c26860 [Clostridium aceticum]|uniref:Uncharacterized protein n=1 Tax=Clostridium aceticum TaxID=84022 RepID=A0A0D8I936_9CLOT|nr:hypothetical protein [Clostridium aceticum]AKL96131.1 hypothetical protein CACET_c26860 [Clostridium aceticum]KJF26559.1 hypothetical protein TZ02_11815 [Clostridium aceticum]